MFTIFDRRVLLFDLDHDFPVSAGANIFGVMGNGGLQIAGHGDAVFDVEIEGIVILEWDVSRVLAIAIGRPQCRALNDQNDIVQFVGVNAGGFPQGRGSGPKR